MDGIFLLRSIVSLNKLDYDEQRKHDIYTKHFFTTSTFQNSQKLTHTAELGLTCCFQISCVEKAFYVFPVKNSCRLQ